MSRDHLPSLDGMRAFSVLLVILSHGSASFSRQSRYYELFVGQLGVSFFFVISGLLITWLMIHERDATGSFSLKNFYIRRCLRILPVFWVLLLTIIALKTTGLIFIHWTDIFRTFTFTHNYPFSIHPPEGYSWWLLHTWSLSLEEQFYLIWPSLFFLLPRKFTPRFAVVLTLSGPILRALNYYFLPSLRGLDNGWFQTHIDILMAGCTSAFLLRSSIWRARIEKIPVAPTLTGIFLFLFLASPIIALDPESSNIHTIVEFFRPTLEALMIAITLLCLIAGKRGSTFRLVNRPFAAYIGKLSYSLYIWQELFLAPGAAINVLSLAWRLAAACLVAFCSFSFIERPFIGLRSQFRRGVKV